MELRTRFRIRLFAFFILLITLFLITIHAHAHIPCMCNNPPDQCTCFIQLGDKGFAVEQIVSVLRGKGYLKNTDIKSTFTPEVKQAVIQFQTDYGLKCTGWMDDETLDAMLFDILPDESIQYPTEFWSAICFVPTDGGKRHHSDPACSGMLNPRMISRVNAISLGIKPCGKDNCKKSVPLTYSSLGLEPRNLPNSYYAKEETIISDRSLLSDNIESTYIGNKNSHVFHLSICSSAKNMSDKNKIEFTTRDEAIGKGYKPCGKCNP